MKIYLLINHQTKNKNPLETNDQHKMINTNLLVVGISGLVSACLLGSSIFRGLRFKTLTQTSQKLTQTSQTLRTITNIKWLMFGFSAGLGLVVGYRGWCLNRRVGFLNERLWKLEKRVANIETYGCRDR